MMVRLIAVAMSWAKFEGSIFTKKAIKKSSEVDNTMVTISEQGTVTGNHMIVRTRLD